MSPGEFYLTSARRIHIFGGSLIQSCGELRKSLRLLTRAKFRISSEFVRVLTRGHRRMSSGFCIEGHIHVLAGLLYLSSHPRRCTVEGTPAGFSGTHSHPFESQMPSYGSQATEADRLFRFVFIAGFNPAIISPHFVRGSR